jgi:integrase
MKFSHSSTQNADANTPKQGKKKPKFAGWPKTATVGRTVIRIYKRLSPANGECYMVGNYSTGKRRWDCYHDEALALEEAAKLARRMNDKNVEAASLTKDEAREYVTARDRLKKFSVTVDAGTAALEQVLTQVATIAKLHEAVSYFASKHRPLEQMPVTEATDLYLEAKEKDGARPYYIETMSSYLTRFARDHTGTLNNVTKEAALEWLDGLEVKPNTWNTTLIILRGFFRWASERKYADKDLLEEIRLKKVTLGTVQIYTPLEMRRLIAASTPEFLPCLVLGGFAGIRSIEVQRLHWEDIDLKFGKHGIITVNPEASKTASRRTIQIAPNLSEWLLPYAKSRGLIWKGTDYDYNNAQYAVAADTEVPANKRKGAAYLAPIKWRKNSLRHSFASYRWAQLMDSGRVAGEMGNSAAMVNKHYRELVKDPAEAERWFGIVPEKSDKIISLDKAATA